MTEVDASRPRFPGSAAQLVEIISPFADGVAWLVYGDQPSTSPVPRAKIVMHMQMLKQLAGVWQPLTFRQGDLEVVMKKVREQCQSNWKDAILPDEEACWDRVMARRLITMCRHATAAVRAGRSWASGIFEEKQAKKEAEQAKQMGAGTERAKQDKEQAKKVGSVMKRPSMMEENAPAAKKKKKEGPEAPPASASLVSPEAADGQEQWCKWDPINKVAWLHCKGSVVEHKTLRAPAEGKATSLMTAVFENGHGWVIPTYTFQEYSVGSASSGFTGSESWQNRAGSR